MQYTLTCLKEKGVLCAHDEHGRSVLLSPFENLFIFVMLMVSWYTLVVQYQEDKTQIKEVVKSGKVWFLCIIVIYILLLAENSTH